MAINPSQFETRNAVENYSIKFINEQTQFIAEEVFPSVVVPKTQTKKYQYDLSHLRSVETRTASKAPANKVDFGVFTSNLTTELHKLAGDIDPRDVVNADAAVADQEFDQAENIMSRLLIKREVLMNTLVSTSASYPSANTSSLAAGATWAVAGGDPEADAKTCHAAIFATCGKPADSIALSYTGYLTLRFSPALRDRVKYTKATAVSDEDLKSLLNVQNIHVCAARQNTAIEGAADVLAEIWDDHALFYVKGSGGKRSIGYGQTWMRNQIYSHTYVDETRGSGDGRIKVLEMGLEYVMTAGGVISSSDSDFACGYFLDNIF
jgi:hypothetical protein